jgi:uncharacterized membrane protein
VVFVMMLAYSAVFITISAVKYEYFLYNDFDLAIFAQAAHTTAHGSLYNSILGMNYLGSHTSLTMFLIAPVYRVLAHPVTLLVLQTLVLACGALPVYWLARRELVNEFAARCFAALYLLYPALGYSNLYEFHPETLTTTTLLFTFYFMWVGRFGVMLLFAVLSLAAKEDVPLVVMAMGFYSLLIRRPRRWVYAATLVGLATLFLVLSFGVIMPGINQGEVQYERFYSQWGDSPGQALVHMAKSPVRVVSAFFGTEGDPWDTRIKREYPLHMLMPVMLLSLLSPLTLAIALPGVAQHLMSSRVSEHSIVWHYTAQITPFVMMGAVLGLRNLLRAGKGVRNLLCAAPVRAYRQKVPDPCSSPGGISVETMNAKGPPRTLARVLSGLAVVVAAGSNVLFGPVIGLEIFQTHTTPEEKWPTAYDRALAPYMRTMVARVPAEGAIACEFRFLSRFTNRPDVHSLHHIAKGTHTYSGKAYQMPEDVVATVADTSDPRFLTFLRGESGGRLRAFMGKNRLEFADAAGDAVLLLREPKESIRLLEIGEYTPEVRRRTDYNGQLGLLGWDTLPASAEVGGRVPIRTFWERLGTVDRFYLTQFLLLDEHDRAVGTRVRHLGYTFYPVHDWPGQGIVRETYHLVVPLGVKPGTYTVALRVVEQTDGGLAVSRPSDGQLVEEGGVLRFGKIEVTAGGH